MNEAEAEADDQAGDQKPEDSEKPSEPWQCPNVPRLDMVCMPEEMFNRAAMRTSMNPQLIRAAARVLITQASVTTQANKISQPPSVIARACKRLIELASEDPRERIFADWLAQRVEPAPNITAPGGRKVQAYITAKELQADLAKFADCVWGPSRFGRYMQANGHASTLLHGTTIYPNLRIKHAPGEPLGNAETRRQAIESAIKEKKPLGQLAPDIPPTVGLRVGWLSRQPD